MGAILGIITQLLGWLQGIPMIGQIASVVVGVVTVLTMLVNGFVLAWHGLVVLMASLAQIPGLSGLQSLSDSLKADETKIDDFANNVLLPILNQLSAIPIPKMDKKAALMKALAKEQAHLPK